MRRVPTTNERKRNAAFLHGFHGDTYICTILKEKILHSVNHELNNVQVISFADIADIEVLIIYYNHPANYLLTKYV